MRKSNDYDFGRKVYAALSSILTPDSSMLDIGAGPGSFTIPFAQHIKSVTAIEPSKGMVAFLIGRILGKLANLMYRSFKFCIICYFHKGGHLM